VYQIFKKYQKIGINNLLVYFQINQSLRLNKILIFQFEFIFGFDNLVNLTIYTYYFKKYGIKNDPFISKFYL